jgi:hypothetical protein
VERTIEAGALTPDLAVPGGRVARTDEVTAGIVRALAGEIPSETTAA